MSRIGKKAINIPNKTEVIIDKNKKIVLIKGVKGELSYTIPEIIEINKIDNLIEITRKNENKEAKSMHGLSRSILNNMIQGVSIGFEKKLLIQGVGYRSQMEGKTLILNMGYSHAIRIKPPKDITIKVENNTTILISGINKETVGEVTAKIRNIRPPEPYKGKGIKYENENIRRKVGKAGK
uniref:Large ribosomal subunit protein uL6c n=1 Tax=Lophocladia kuetzingii TaxID=675577 RepID=A0A1Z1MPL4_9FLOR|nr:ribosomal protein L6 [Lophocladia kuetzingii]ARW67711.1 ribosomal protein L6 [Lophocladia kuetzingii]